MEARILLLLAIIFSSAICFPQDEQSSAATEGILTDGRDGQEYRWVKIGNQVWMAQNLNVGDLVVIRNNEISKIVLVERYCYDDNYAYCKKFGGLYTDNTILQYLDGESSQSICPAGWHLPSEGEWMQLLNYLGGPEVAGGALKDTIAIWQGKVDKTATNSTGFTALPGGSALFDENAFGYGGVGKFCYFWTSTETYSLIYDHKGLRFVYLTKNKNNVHFAKIGVGAAHSVRCVKDQSE
jgi:uncharacterized protein (TIGR02145 family)